MSVNLRCNVLDLWQTPTWFTDAVIEAEDHRTRLRMYMWWVIDQNIKVIKTPEDLEFYKARQRDIKKHLKQIEKALKNPNLRVDYI